MKSLAHPGMYPNGPDRPAQKRPERAFLKKSGHIRDAQGVPQVGLGCAELQHSLSVTVHRIGSLCYGETLGRKFFKDGGKDFLPRPEDLLLTGKVHLKIKLVKFARRPVCPGVLVPEARGDLKIPVNSGHHQQLLILLGRLGKRIKFPLVFTGRDNVIPGPFR